MKKWKTRHVEDVLENPFVHIKKEIVELPGGKVIDDYLVHDYPDWVNAVVLTKQRNIVLVKQYRHAGKDSFLEIPAGKREQGESDIEGMAREIREETGFSSALPLIELGNVMVNPAIQTNEVKTFLMLDAEQKHNQDLDETEEIHIELIDFDEFGDMIQRQLVQTQLFTVHGYYLAKNYLKDHQLI